MNAPTLMRQDRVALADIIVTARLRPVSEAGVESLIASITETRVMKDAIHVRKRHDGGLILLAGAHRVEAARRLGWTEIEAKVWTDVTDDWARLIEIDDNLAGAEMNALDTAVFLANRKAVYEKLHPAATHGGDRRSAEFQTDIMSVRSFAAATAEKFGVTDRHVRRMVALGTSLSPTEIAALREAPKPVQLKDLADLAKIADRDERSMVVLRLSAGNAKSAAEARRTLKAGSAGETPVKDPVEDQFKALLKAWNRAGAAARRRFAIECAGDIRAAATARESEDA